MTKRRSEIELAKKTLNLGRGDFEAMGALFPTMGASTAIRILVHNYVQKVRQATAPVDIELPTPEEIKELFTNE